MDAVAFYGQAFHMRCIKMVFSQTLILGKYLQHFVEFFFAENFTFNAESLRERKLCYHGLDENKFHDEFGCYSTPGKPINLQFMERRQKVLTFILDICYRGFFKTARRIL